MTETSVPSRILLVPSDGCPLEDRSPGRFQELDPGGLELSEPLRARRAAWVEAYAMAMDDWLEWPTQEAELAVHVEGDRIATQLQVELGLGTRVMYAWAMWSREAEQEWIDSLPAMDYVAAPPEDPEP